MGDRGEAFRLLLTRLLIASPLIAVGFFLVSRLHGAGALFLILPVFLIGGPVAALVTDPVKGVHFSWKKGRGERLPFSLPEAMVMEGKLDEALDQYRGMLARDPQNLEVYLRIVELTLLQMKKPDLARDFLHRGMKKLRKQSQRDSLAAEYRRLMTLFRENNRHLLYTGKDQGSGSNPFA